MKSGNTKFFKFFRSNAEYTRRLEWTEQNVSGLFHAMVISTEDGLLKPHHCKLIQKEYMRVVAYNTRLRKRQLGVLGQNKSNITKYPYTKKPIGVRMGRGKAGIDGIAIPICKGQDIMIFRRGTHIGLIEKMVRQLNFKLPIYLRMVVRRLEDSASNDNLAK